MLTTFSGTVGGQVRQVLLYLYVQLVSDSAAQAASHRLLTARARCFIPENSMRDLARRTCRYAAGRSQITRTFLCNRHYTSASC